MRSHFISLVASLLGNTVLATRLYAASYAGSVTSLALTKTRGAYELSTLSKTAACGSSPSWLMLDSENSILYCLDEGITALNGSVTTFKTNQNGTLSMIQHLKTLTGPVMSAMYSAPQVSKGQFLAVAHYSASSVTTYAVDPAQGLFNHSQTFVYEMTGPGPVPSRQDAPHPHGVIVDPTGRFVLVPDLGADLVRIFEVSPLTGYLDQVEPLAVTLGSGPRHGVFWTPKGAKNTSTDVYFYLVQELSNSLSGFRVIYSEDGISFAKVYEGSTYGNRAPPTGSKAAEIAISPENNHVIVSNRLDSTFGRNSDSFAVFACADASGKFFEDVSFLGLHRAHGSSPRQFSINGDLDMVAVALESSQRVAVTRWNKRTGSPGILLVEKQMDGDIPAVVWDL
ncbi:Lactonase, 7-bladed beta-propeller-domain-containing protein [Talaromyces proteolyticus]|uniref:Lactonase, 7-bladed beta-propeller-domain-containing protein n=1 Tax=Talaromyces proteolyticus TaxID=1131652 RepID=A0AAD4KV19_9EURO|nr:Lactonase, 7-bladed beta-propeller-domain-containing protein [Talaromyces proteolyticus]KAH8700510.1 Lactonase, 7-bladed beta-propeller-domain-containing protein [Talaromyces proteolyticus]